MAARFLVEMMIVFVCLLLSHVISSVHFALMRPKGSQRINPSPRSSTKSLPIWAENGVTLPDEGQIKGWEFGDAVRLACAKVDGSPIAVSFVGPEQAVGRWLEQPAKGSPTGTRRLGLSRGCRGSHHRMHSWSGNLLRRKGRKATII
jgi:hypothetical protein